MWQPFIKTRLPSGLKYKHLYNLFFLRLLFNPTANVFTQPLLVALNQQTYSGKGTNLLFPLSLLPLTCPQKTTGSEHAYGPNLPIP